MLPNGGSIAALAQRILARGHAASHDSSHEDPRSLIKRLGYWLEASTEIVLPYVLEASGAGFWYGWRADPHLSGLHAWLGLAAIELQSLGMPSSDELVRRVAGRLIIPENTTYVDPSDYPFAPGDFLRAVIWQRRGSMSGLYLVPRTG